MVQRHFGGSRFGMYRSPFLAHKPKHKKRNPGAVASMTGKISHSVVHPFHKQVGYDVAAMTVGAVGTALIPALVMKDKNTGLKSYGFNLVTSIILGTATKLITKKTDLAVKVMLGGILAMVLRAISNVAAGSTSKVAAAYSDGSAPASFSGLGVSRDKIRRQIEAQITENLRKGVAGRTTLPYKTIEGRTTLPYQTIGLGPKELAAGEEGGIAADTM